MSDTDRKSQQKRRGKGKGDAAVGDSHRLSTSHPDVLKYVFMYVAPRHKGKGRWKSVRAGLLYLAPRFSPFLSFSRVRMCVADVFAELLLDVPAQHLRKAVDRHKKWFSSHSAAAVNWRTIQFEILRTVTPSLNTVEKLHSYLSSRHLLWSERLKAAEVLHSLSPTAETEAAVRAACADVTEMKRPAVAVNGAHDSDESDDDSDGSGAVHVIASDDDDDDDNDDDDGDDVKASAPA